MKRIHFAIAAYVAGFFLLVLATPTFACQEGAFNVKGWNPGVDPSTKPTYSGSVKIKKSGESYVLNWKIANDEFVGIGACDAVSKTLYVSYAHLEAGWFGVVFYDKNLNGKWAVSGATQDKWGSESLTKK